MNKCAYYDCENEPRNPAVPACDMHLCPECRMSVGVKPDSGRRFARICAVCSRANPPQSSV